MLLAALLVIAPTQDFSAPRILESAVSGPSTTLAVDWDGDGLRDTLTYDYRLRRLLYARSQPGMGPGSGTGSGTGQATSRLETLFAADLVGGPLSPVQLQAVDLDGDGDLDLYAALQPAGSAARLDLYDQMGGSWSLAQ
ncbi:FG-GAP repeat protein [Planctomycetes bacterium Poly30]|uniref:FG-GAP repeat protein n=1 Tax=Saltatorellus ferox TaxID=2528018 RepID=A0A518ETK8_9BACT|nr:FG-GAP repeat protein [Planctomycetes bacterium Poly30]